MHFKVALKRFIDDMSVQVIEAKLVAELDRILTPVSIFEMSPEQVARIAGESEERRGRREQLTKQRDVLAEGLHTCKRFVGLRICGGKITLSLRLLASRSDGR